MNGSSNFDIKVAEQVIDEAIMNNKPHYLIKWKYLPHEFDTWEALENLQSITHLLQSWIKNKRQHKQLNTLNSVSSYVDTVNYIDPAKKQQRKRKPISKAKRAKTSHKEIVILDEENQTYKNIAENQSDKFFIDDSEQTQNLDMRRQITEQSYKQCNWNVEDSQAIENSCKVETNETSSQPLKYDPEEQIENKIVQEGQKMKKGMKVVGRIKSEDIETLLERFKFRDQWCFKLGLKDGRITNMREEDLKKLCPQALMEFYEDHNIKV